jgi:AcrR family transcriptional regulator
MGTGTATARAKVARAERDAPRERIVRCATELLADGGPGALTLRAVGTRVGLHNSSLFYHFPASTRSWPKCSAA